MPEMTDQNFMNFFVEQAAPDAAVVPACSRACGLPLESEAYLQEGSVGFVQVVPYSEGFEMGLCIIWPPSTPVSLSQAAVARDIARALRQRVLFDEEDPAAASGERWMLATSDGALLTVDVREYDDGVVLAKGSGGVPIGSSSGGCG